MLSALVAIIPDFDYSRSCNNSNEDTFNKLLVNISSDKSNQVSAKELQDLNSSRIVRNATSPIKIGKGILKMDGF